MSHSPCFTHFEFELILVFLYLQIMLEFCPFFARRRRCPDFFWAISELLRVLCLLLWVKMFFYLYTTADSTLYDWLPFCKLQTVSYVTDKHWWKISFRCLLLLPEICTVWIKMCVCLCVCVCVCVCVCIITNIGLMNTASENLALIWCFNLTSHQADCQSLSVAWH